MKLQTPCQKFQLNSYVSLAFHLCGYNAWNGGNIWIFSMPVHINLPQRSLKHVRARNTDLLNEIVAKLSMSVAKISR